MSRYWNEVHITMHTAYTEIKMAKKVHTYNNCEHVYELDKWDLMGI